MIRSLTLEYYSKEHDEAGVPLAVLSYKPEAECAPFLDCLMLAQQVPAKLDPRHLEYFREFVRDIYAASNHSHEAALILFSRLEAISFGPIRFSSVQ